MRVISLVLIPLTFLTTNGFASRSYTTGPGPDSTYFGNAVVSYTIEGKKTTIKNILQTEGQNITALHLNVVTLIPKQNLVRVNFTNSLTHEVFDFVVADKGTTIVQHYKPRLTVEIEKKAIYMSQKLMNYYSHTLILPYSHTFRRVYPQVCFSSSHKVDKSRDPLPSNQKIPSSFWQEFRSSDISSIKHPALGSLNNHG